MYRVSKPDPDIIARQSDTALPADAFQLQHKNPKDAQKKFDILVKFLGGTSVGLIKKVARLHQFIDWMIKDLGIPGKAVCQRGCAHCCSIDVVVGVVEAHYIADRMGLTMFDREKRLKKGYHLTDHYCPFLDKSNGECGIYEYRPITCRTFHAFDHPKFCEGMDDHAIYADRANPVVMDLLRGLSESGGYKYADIREWFDIKQEV